MALELCREGPNPQLRRIVSELTIKMVTDDAVAIRVGSRLLDKVADHAYCLELSGVNQTGNSCICDVGQVIKVS